MTSEQKKETVAPVLVNSLFLNTNPPLFFNNQVLKNSRSPKATISIHLPFLLKAPYPLSHLQLKIPYSVNLLPIEKNLSPRHLLTLRSCFPSCICYCISGYILRDCHLSSPNALL